MKLRYSVWKERGGKREKTGRKAKGGDGERGRGKRRRKEGEISRRHRDANPMAELAFLPIVEHISQEMWEGFKDTVELGGSWKMLSIATC